MDDFIMLNWYGVLAPAGTPMAVVQILNREISKALAVTETRERLGSLAFDITPSTVKEFTQLLGNELKHWKIVVAQTQL